MVLPAAEVTDAGEENRETRVGSDQKRTPLRGDDQAGVPAAADRPQGSRRTSRQKLLAQRRRRSRRRLLLASLPLLFVAVGVAVVLLSLGGERRGGAGVVQGTTSSITGGQSEFREAISSFDLDQVAAAKFASVTVTGPDGVSSYMITPQRPEFGPLAAAVAGAQKVAGQTAAGDEALQLTFVTRERETITLLVGEGGTFTWQGQAYRAKQDLRALAEAAARAGTGGSTGR